MIQRMRRKLLCSGGGSLEVFLVNGTAEGVKVSSLRHNPSSVPRIKVPKLLCSGGGFLRGVFGKWHC